MSDIRIEDQLPSFNPFTINTLPGSGSNHVENDVDVMPLSSELAEKVLCRLCLQRDGAGDCATLCAQDPDNAVNTFQRVLFSNISIANISTTRACPAWGGGCSCHPQCSVGPLPTGPPNLLVAGEPSNKISNVAFNKITVAGEPLHKVIAKNRGLFNLSGSVSDITVDGIPLV